MTRLRPTSACDRSDGRIRRNDGPLFPGNRGALRSLRVGISTDSRGRDAGRHSLGRRDRKRLRSHSYLSAPSMSAECTLIADRTDDAVQLALGFIALSSLYCKWHFETPRRAAKIWFLDAMKQGTSAAMIHVLNIVCAIATADDSAKASSADECAFYFMNVVIDTTLGVYIAYLLLQFVTALAVRRNWSTLKHPGRYGDPPSLRVWTSQLISWMIVLAVMKLIVAIAIYIFRTPLGFIGSLVFYPVHHHPKVELLIVMIGCPLVMNMVQFWIQDSFLKDHAHTRAAEESAINTHPTQYGGTAETKRELRNLFGLLSTKSEDPINQPQPKQHKKKKVDGSSAEDMYEVL